MNISLAKTISDLNEQKYQLEKDIIATTSQLMASCDILDEDTFWAHITLLRSEIDKATINYGKLQGLKFGIHNYFCRQKAETAVMFVRSYQYYSRIIHSDDSIWDHAEQYTYMSDDTWHDFCDYLPLRGKIIYDAVKNKGKDPALYEKYEEAYIHSTLMDKVVPFISNLI